MKELIENWRNYLKEQAANSTAFDEAASDTMSAMTVFADEGSLTEEEAAGLQYEFSLAKSPNPEVLERFTQSLYSGARAGFLSAYSESELRSMDLYMIKGHNAGFAIKDGDDIVSVHNNSSLRGLGSEFMRKAKEVGGRRLDHFDGFLSGLYRRYGFTDVYEVYQWDEQYKPKGWKYDAVDITNPATSIYAETIKDKVNVDRDIKVKAEDNFVIEINPANKVNQYRYGRPDVIMRKLA